jgi:Spy/CpxP family protein refolding chaperone
VYRVFAVLAVLVTVLLIGGGLQGQDKKDDKKEPPPLRGVLPPNFGKIGLSEEQKQRIYKIEADAREKIAELEKKISELKEKEKQDLLSVLTDEQKKKLKEILEAKADK